MNTYLLILLVLSAICAIFSLTQHFQMLQQNSYFASRYFGWLRQSYNTSFLVDAVFYFLVTAFYLLKFFRIGCVVTAIILITKWIKSNEIQKTSIKPLVFTDRVKRMYLITILLFALLIGIYAKFPTTLVARFAITLCLILGFISMGLTFAVWGITLPIEKRISQYYVNDAVKILKSRPDLKVIGITGSYGKTTTKFILTRILSEKFNVVCTPLSYNTPMGVVKTIRTLLKPQTQIFVCEMGAKNVGDIKEICDIANPNYGLITSVGPQHLETFKTVDNVFKTKFELADAVKQNGGAVFVNGDSKEIIDRLDGDYIKYGTNKKFDFFGQDLSYGRDGSQFTLKLGDEKVTFSTKLLGLHSIIDIIGAISVAYTLGVPVSDIQFAVASLKPAEHRLELKPFQKGSLLIDDAYNSNPEGCLEAVRVLGSFDGMKKVIITPGLVELGTKEYECNYALGKEAAKNCDVIILVGKNRSKPMQDAVNESDFNTSNLYVVSSFKEALSIYSQIADNNTVVLFENDLPDNYLY